MIGRQSWCPNSQPSHTGGEFSQGGGCAIDRSLVPHSWQMTEKRRNQQRPTPSGLAIFFTEHSVSINFLRTLHFPPESERITWQLFSFRNLGSIRGRTCTYANPTFTVIRSIRLCDRCFSEGRMETLRRTRRSSRNPAAYR